MRLLHTTISVGRETGHPLEGPHEDTGFCIANFKSDIGNAETAILQIEFRAR